eukprot:499022-Pyramimonas_sp.AAC.1
MWGPIGQLGARRVLENKCGKTSVRRRRIIHRQDGACRRNDENTGSMMRMTQVMIMAALWQPSAACRADQQNDAPSAHKLRESTEGGEPHERALNTRSTVKDDLRGTGKRKLRLPSGPACRRATETSDAINA